MYKWEYGTLYLYNNDKLVTGFRDNELSILFDYNEGDIVKLNIGTPETVKKRYDKYMQRYIKRKVLPKNRADLRIITFIVTEADVSDLNRIVDTTGALETWLKKKQIKLDQTI